MKTHQDAKKIFNRIYEKVKFNTTYVYNFTITISDSILKIDRLCNKVSKHLNENDCSYFFIFLYFSILKLDCNRWSIWVFLTLKAYAAIASDWCPFPSPSAFNPTRYNVADLFDLVSFLSYLLFLKQSAAQIMLSDCISLFHITHIVQFFSSFYIWRLLLYCISARRLFKRFLYVSILLPSYLPAYFHISAKSDLYSVSSFYAGLSRTLSSTHNTIRTLYSPSHCFCIFGPPFLRQETSVLENINFFFGSLWAPFIYLQTAIVLHSSR